MDRYDLSIRVTFLDIRGAIQKFVDKCKLTIIVGFF